MKQFQDLYKFEMRLVPIVVKMQLTGMRVDRDFCEEKSVEYGNEWSTTYIKICELLEKNNIDSSGFKPSSPQQVAGCLKHFEIPITDHTPTGQMKTDKDALMPFANHPFIKLLNLLRFYAKHKGTYYDSLLEYYTTAEDDIAHFDLYQAGTKTGRFSAQLIQTFPKPKMSKLLGRMHEVRKVIIPRENKWLVCIDQQQAQMWLFIHYANCERMIEKAGRGVDAYMETAVLMYGKEMMSRNKELKKALRDISKTIALGLIFTMGKKKLIASILHEAMDDLDQETIDEIGIDRRWAIDVLDEFYHLYPVREFNNRITSEVYRKGYIELNFNSELMKFHRRYNIPSHLAYKGGNAIIQGSEAYVIKSAMLRLTSRFKREGWKWDLNNPEESDVALLMQVHDELIFEVDKSMNLKKVVRILIEEIEDNVTFRVPIFASAKISDKNWADVKEFEYA